MPGEGGNGEGRREPPHMHTWLIVHAVGGLIRANGPTRASALVPTADKVIWGKSTHVILGRSMNPPSRVYMSRAGFSDRTAAFE